MELTYYGANSWLLDLGHSRLLIDPWLVADLVFGHMPWLFRGVHTQPLTIPTHLTAVVLSQGLPDHAHRPTLEQLPRSLPVIASPSGAAVVRQLGYETVIALAPGETLPFSDRLELRATVGAPIGPQRENGYIIRDLTTGHQLYYEPHGFYDPQIADWAPVDVVISPAVNLELPVVGAIIQGDRTALNLIQALQPQVFLPTANGGDIQYEGILDNLLKIVGSCDRLRQHLTAQQIATTVIEPQSGQVIAIPLTARCS